MATLKEQLDGMEQMLTQVEDLASIELAKAEKDTRIGRRGRYYYRDIVSRLFIGAWQALALGRKLANLPEPPADVVESLIRMELELSSLVHQVPLFLDAVLSGEDLPAMKRAEGWPRLREYWEREAQESGGQEGGKGEKGGPPAESPKE